MLFSYFRLQLHLFLRKFRSQGVHPVLGILILVLIFLLVDVSLLYKLTNGVYVFWALQVVLVFRASGNFRTEFLMQVFNKRDYYKIRVFENLVLGFPFFVGLMIGGYIMEAFAGLALVILPAFYRIPKSSSIVIPTPYYKVPFEFASGFRQSVFILFLLYILTAISPFIPNFSLGAVSVLILGVIPWSYYQKPEDEFLIWIHSNDPPSFLWMKIKTALKYTFLTQLPALIWLTAFFPVECYVLYGVTIFTSLCLILIIAGKYYSYPEPLSIPVSMIMFIAIISVALLPVVLIFFLTKSISRIKKYLV